MSPLRRNLKLAVIAFVVADLALIGWLLSPRAPSRAANRQQLMQAQAQLATLRARAAQLSHLHGQLQTSQQQIQSLIQTGIPAQADASSTLLTEFSRIAAASQVQVSGADFKPDQAARQGLRRVAVSLQVAGGYTGAVRFLNGLERSPLFFILNQVSVSGSDATGAAGASSAGPDQVKLQVELEAYVRS